MKATSQQSEWDLKERHEGVGGGSWSCSDSLNENFFSKWPCLIMREDRWTWSSQDDLCAHSSLGSKKKWNKNEKN